MTAPSPKPDTILFGPQGSGKGTQASLLRDNFNYHVIGTGDLMRAYATHQDALGKKIKGLIERGELVPDNVIETIFTHEVAKVVADQPLIFDGYPRNLNQAKFLDGLLEQLGRPASLAVYLDLPRAVVFERLASRYVCTKCGTIVRNLPGLLRKLVCPKCGTPVEMRKDDRPEIIETRLNLFFSQTFPLIDFYEKQQRLRKIDGQPPITDVHTAIRAALNIV